MDKNTIGDIEQKIGYTFKNKRLLEQAFVRRSYSKEHPETLDNEILEFYGDEALDYYVTRAMYEEYSSVTKDRQFYSEKSENELSDLRSYHVDTESLSHCIEIFGFQDYLLMNESDKKNSAKNSPSVMADLFEAIVGAVVVDSKWEFESIRIVCETMLNLSGFDINYIKWINNWCAERGYTPYFRPTLGLSFQNYLNEPYLGLGTLNPYTRQMEFRNFNPPSFSSMVNGACLVIHEVKINVQSDIQGEYTAYMDCAEKAYRIIQSREMKESIDKPDISTAVNQLNILYQKEFISEPEYFFNEQHDDDGNPIWECKCCVDELKYYYTGKASIKRDAKKQAAYNALCALLNEKGED